MPGETSLLKLKYAEEKDERSSYPTAVDEPRAKSLEEYILAAKLVEHGASFTAKVGELALATGSGTTVTLPAASLNATVGAFAAGGITKVKTVSGAKIYGDFTAGVETIELTTNQHVLLRANGTNWFVVGGEPKREQVYGARTERALGSTIAAPSTTRPTFVIVDVQLTPSTVSGSAVTFYVNGTAVAEVFQQLTASGVDSNVRPSASFIVPPGQTWEAAATAGTAESLH